ncbi:MAG: hypothetical protein ACN23H_02340 [Candidatus Phytoplasma vitis]|nr:MAG: hypothetical protein M6G77_01585 [Candidatus Phytoplasma vitis]
MKNNEINIFNATNYIIVNSKDDNKLTHMKLITKRQEIINEVFKLCKDLDGYELSCISTCCYKKL